MRRTAQRRCYGHPVSSIRRFAGSLGALVTRFPRTTMALAAVVGLLIALVIGSNAYVLFSTRGDSTREVEEVPHAQAAIVLGALVHSDGRLSDMLEDRVATALNLWQAGKVDRILVSGDHGEWIYDEPDAMRLALLEAGVPARAIFTDHAGFDTWASMVRAREVFEVETAVVVTQNFHMARALYLADAAGLDATGMVADRRSYHGQGMKSNVRELGSRVKAVGDVAFDSGVTPGPVIPITGDGRASWGPDPPTGTPPAGVPR